MEAQSRAKQQCRMKRVGHAAATKAALKALFPGAWRENDKPLCAIRSSTVAHPTSNKAGDLDDHTGDVASPMVLLAIHIDRPRTPRTERPASSTTTT